MALGSFRLSYITFYALIAVFFVWILWNKTRFGKNIFAIGGNPEAAKVSGVNVALNLLMIYALSGRVLRLRRPAGSRSYRFGDQ
ncbi:Galactose/methyl galactoside ABC transport system [Klebsiella pneumoniae]|uniref:Galactose/methyl galactoside ABC transport system n=1 Tax=Klebsiella pneumoniae TaxID=573 RepID=A0A378G320_KLEPN|nr:Galactose/methyl galactoside ABC transport system [Klebsiella pneumoniae]